jgi:probable rRNA maturation factor
MAMAQPVKAQPVKACPEAPRGAKAFEIPQSWKAVVTSSLPGETFPIEIAMTDDAWDTLLPEPELWARRILDATLSEAQAEQEGCGLSLLLADDAEIQLLNQRFRGKDKPTNVLSFPAHPMAGSGSLGDIALALETVRAEAEAGGMPMLYHLSHLLAHGILHLLGFTHDEDDQAERMMAIESAVMARLGLPDPYPRNPEPMVKVGAA